MRLSVCYVFRCDLAGSRPSHRCTVPMFTCLYNFAKSSLALVFPPLWFHHPPFSPSLLSYPLLSYPFLLSSPHPPIPLSFPPLLSSPLNLLFCYLLLSSLFSILLPPFPPSSSLLPPSLLDSTTSWLSHSVAVVILTCDVNDKCFFCRRSSTRIWCHSVPASTQSQPLQPRLTLPTVTAQVGSSPFTVTLGHQSLQEQFPATFSCRCQLFDKWWLLRVSVFSYQSGDGHLSCFNIDFRGYAAGVV